MADLRKETHGPGSMKDIELVVIAYDNRVARNKDGEVSTHYLDGRIHPGDRRAIGQTALALVSRPDAKAPSGRNNSTRYSVGQFESIKEAAGKNVVDLTTVQGDVVGKIYGVKADLISSSEGLIINTKTLKPSELSVEPNEAGTDIRSQIFELQAESKAAREAAKKETEATAATPEVATPTAEAAGVEEPKASAKKAPAKKAPAAAAATAEKKTPARKPAARKAAVAKELVGAGGVEAASDEPQLG